MMKISVIAGKGLRIACPATQHIWNLGADTLILIFLSVIHMRVLHNAYKAFITSMLSLSTSVREGLRVI
jgi:hypothetical protein